MELKQIEYVELLTQIHELKKVCEKLRINLDSLEIPIGNLANVIALQEEEPSSSSSSSMSSSFEEDDEILK